MQTLVLVHIIDRKRLVGRRQHAKVRSMRVMKRIGGQTLSIIVFKSLYEFELPLRLLSLHIILACRGVHERILVEVESLPRAEGDEPVIMHELGLLDIVLKAWVGGESKVFLFLGCLSVLVDSVDNERFVPFFVANRPYDGCFVGRG